jgi:hypothetical protein
MDNLRGKNRHNDTIRFALIYTLNIEYYTLFSIDEEKVKVHRQSPDPVNALFKVDNVHTSSQVDHIYLFIYMYILIKAFLQFVRCYGVRK